MTVEKQWCLWSLANCRKVLAVLFGSLASMVSAQYNVGDLGAVASGNWTTALVWRTWNGTVWAAPAAIPNAGSTVHILAGSTVVVNGAGPYSVRNVTVEAGAKLWSNNNSINVYLSVYGTTLRCDGQIGDGTNFDGLSFNMEGSDVLISGTGQFDASRLRKSDGVNTTTNLTIAMDVDLRFNSSSTTQIYNNYGAPTVQSRFNVTIASGVTVNLTGAVGSGNVALDGIDGASPAHRGGTFRVLGTLNIPGTLYLTTNNPTGTPACRFEIGNGGVVRAGQIDSNTSGTATHRLVVEDGGTLDCTSIAGWNPFFNAGTTNNLHTFQVSSTMIYSAPGDQLVRNLNYGDLTIRGTGVKTLVNTTIAAGDVAISNTDGAAVLDVGVPSRLLIVNGNWANYAQSGFEERTGQVRFQAAGPNTITTLGGEVFHTARISKGVANIMALGSAVTVTNAFEFNRGILELNGNAITLLGTFTTTDAYSGNHHIRSESADNGGRVRRNIGSTPGAYLIPFGVGTEYIPFTFTLNAGNAGLLSVATYGTGADNLPWPLTPEPVTNLSGLLGLVPDNRDATVDRFWQVDVTGTPTASLAFTYRPAELPLVPWNDPFSLRAQRWNTSTQTWEDSLEGNATAYTVTANTVNSFGPFALAPITAPLPIELLSFTAQLAGSGVDLHWVTLSERNNAYFTVSRSGDGWEFQELLQHEGAGDAMGRTDHSDVDERPLSGWNYYRLRQTDHDGSSSESGTVAVFVKNNTTSLTLYPNPAMEVVTVAGLSDERMVLRVVDAMGRTVLTSSADTDAAQVTMNVAQLASGRYMLVAEGAGRSEVLPFVKH